MAEISDFIDQVLDQDFAKAQPTFAELIGDKMNNAMEQEKIAVAGQVFNGVDPDADEDEIDEPEVDAEAEEGDGSEEFTDEPLAVADEVDEVEDLEDIDVDNITDEEIEDAIDDAEYEEESEE